MVPESLFFLFLPCCRRWNAVVEGPEGSKDLNDTSEPTKIQESEARYSTFGQCELKHI